MAFLIVKMKEIFKPPAGVILADFTRDQWSHSKRPSVPYIVFNIISSIYSLGWVIYSIVEDNTWKWMIFMTNWGGLLIVFESFLQTSLVLRVRINWNEDKYSKDVLPWCHVVSWILFVINFATALTITLIYWVFLYDAEYFRNLVVLLGKIHGNAVFVKSIHFHAINSVYMTMKMLIMAVPVKISHVIFPILLGIIYILFSCIYHVSGGTNTKGQKYIYNIVNWAYPLKTMGIVSGILIIVIAMHIAGYCLYRVRLMLRNNCLQISKKGEPHQTSESLENKSENQ